MFIFEAPKQLFCHVTAKQYPQMKKMYKTAASVAEGMRPEPSYSASSSLPPDFLASAGDPGAPWGAVSSVQFSSVTQ